MQVAQLLDSPFPGHSHWQGLRLGGVALEWLTHILWEADHRMNRGQGWTAQRLETWHRALDPNLTALDFSDDRLRAGLTDLADGDRWIALGAVGYFANANSTCNMHTGVLREYRGRKIALALKLLAIRRSRECRAVCLRTNNNSQNAPILVTNRRLGYKPQPGFFRC
jgi:GNAT superfamily N-acetyltransferase